MLNYLDIYPIKLPARYCNKQACFTKIFIISNWELERQYQELQVTDKESYNAFCVVLIMLISFFRLISTVLAVSSTSQVLFLPCIPLLMSWKI